MRWRICVALVASLGGTARQAPAQAIGGRVVDAGRGIPLPQIRTWIRLPGRDSTLTVQTGPDGTFVLLLPSAGRYQVHLQLDSLTELVSDSIAVGADEFVQKEFRLAPPAPLFFEFQVQKPVVPVRGMLGPRYPEELRARQVEGEVLAQFVVDTTGRVRPRSFRVVRFSDDRSAVSRSHAASDPGRPGVGDAARRRMDRPSARRAGTRRVCEP